MVVVGVTSEHAARPMRKIGRTIVVLIAVRSYRLRVVREGIRMFLGCVVLRPRVGYVWMGRYQSVIRSLDVGMAGAVIA